VNCRQLGTLIVLSSKCAKINRVRGYAKAESLWFA
jgi:hypothetical protein